MSSPAPILSVVIVAYKSREEIGACLHSLPRTLVDGSVDVIVVDNSPGDGTGDVVQNSFPWVRYIAPDENLGFGKANNLGFAATNTVSEFVLILNPDTVCNDAALAHCVKRLSSDEAIGLISPKLVLADGAMDLACRRSIPTMWDGLCRAVGLGEAFPRTAFFCGYNLTHLPDSGTYDVGAINGAFMMGRREVFEAIAQRGSEGAAGAFIDGLPRCPAERGHLAMTDEKQQFSPASSHAAAQIFDEEFFMYGDDLDLCIRVSKAGYRVVYDGSVSITHLKGVSVAKDYETMSQAIFDANRDVYLKHFNPKNSSFVRWKYTLAFGAWKRIARLRARVRDRRVVRPA
jgi:N-acetylglucosaminyl-diphospho-decaprenol L-rhamnosyltransferase